MNELEAWGQRGNFVSILTDCPQRDERLGWIGDAGAFWRTGTYNFDVDAFTRKFMLDVTDAQRPAGAFTDVSPNILEPVRLGGVTQASSSLIRRGCSMEIRQSWSGPGPPSSRTGKQSARRFIR